MIPRSSSAVGAECFTEQEDPQAAPNRCHSGAPAGAAKFRETSASRRFRQSMVAPAASRHRPLLWSRLASAGQMDVVQDVATGRATLEAPNPAAYLAWALPLRAPSPSLAGPPRRPVASVRGGRGSPGAQTWRRGQRVGSPPLGASLARIRPWPEHRLRGPCCRNPPLPHRLIRRWRAALPWPGCAASAWFSVAHGDPAGSALRGDPVRDSSRTMPDARCWPDFKERGG